MVRVAIPPPFRGPTGGAAKVEVEGATVEESLRAVGVLHPGFLEQVFDARGVVHRFVKLFVNGEPIEPTALGTPVGEGDEVAILAAVAGG